MTTTPNDDLPPWPDLRDMEGFPIADRTSELAPGKVGFVYDINRRVYRRNEKGRAEGPPIELYHYVPVLLTGMTRMSWVTRRYGKIAKRGIHGHANGVQGQVIGLLDVEDRLWWDENHIRVVRALESRAVSFDQLRRIVAIIDETLPG